MANSIERNALLEALMFLMEETFEGHPKPGSYYLDTGTGWSATLEGIDAKTASHPTHAGGTTIAGHIEHTRFYMAVVREFVKGRTDPADWSESWRVKSVSEEEWTSLKQALAEESENVRSLMRETNDWDEDTLSSAIGLIAHCSYHLGAVRQMVKVLKS